MITRRFLLRSLGLGLPFALYSWPAMGAGAQRNFPQTPTTHAIRTNQYKYVHYHGIWDIDELFDLAADPLEADNLIHSPGHEAVIAKLNKQLFETLSATGGMSIPLAEDSGEVNKLRRSDKAKAAEFPPELLRRVQP